MNSSTIQALAPSSEFKASYVKQNQLVINMTDFINYEKNVLYQLVGLSGQAQTIMIQIKNSLLPRLQSGANQVLTDVQAITTCIKQFMQDFQRFCDAFTSRAFPVANNWLTNLQSDANNIASKLNDLNNVLDQYHTSVNNLIAALGSEQDAINSQNTSLVQEKQKIIDRIKARTTTVCGVIRTFVDSLTGQLERDINNDSAEIAAATAQYNANSIAIGRMQNLVSQTESYRGALEQQQKFWTNLNVNFASLNGDMSGFESDPESVDIYFEAIKEDWAEIARS